ncbi:carboxypeptidase-like regulatory domain-containing protein [Aureitalea marina]|uniref:Carboxypeptidase-like regulatory domain-containing protein n=1 Tax=Aureitalea marina TaxID=930804 RepID=A0A2S7KRQ2_9FLAO|nr:carboxypeptidase-like regulatory domain-containing protein [Aureitalea marina]PQB05296.1 hypothetical protein BST85_10680 [Aureitalea marina]
MKSYPLFIILLLATTFGLRAQSYTARVVDSATSEPIPFATVILGKNAGVITNEEGVFSITADQREQISDSVYISSMGYGKRGIWLGDAQEAVIRLPEQTYELKGVFLSANVLSVDEILEQVKANLDKNYAADMSRKKIFFRQSDFSLMDKMDIEFKESSIEELNEELMDSIIKLIPRESSYYKEAVGDFYGDYRSQKLFVERAAELYDKDKDVSMDGISEKLETIFKENVKSDSYLKVKSGIFGTKIQLDSARAAGNDDATIQVEVEDETDYSSFQKQIKWGIDELYEQLFFQEDSELDILSKSNRYKYELDGYTMIDNGPAYVLKFNPKGKKDFKGTMYVNVDDFAVVRLEFENVRPLSKFGLLGIRYRHNVYRGKMLFGKDETGAYSPRYLELEDGEVVGVDRPLKVIEKNKNVKGRRKQNELSLHFDMGVTSLSKYEMVVFETEGISKSDFQSAKENPKVKATYLSQYDPTFWEGYAIMEPNEAIQAFRVGE